MDPLPSLIITPIDPPLGLSPLDKKKPIVLSHTDIYRTRVSCKKTWFLPVEVSTEIHRCQIVFNCSKNHWTAKAAARLRSRTPRQMALSSSFIASQSHLIDSLFMTSELQKQQVLYSKPREVHSIVFPSDQLRQKAINQDHHQSINPKKRRHSTCIRVHIHNSPYTLHGID